MATALTVPYANFQQGQASQADEVDANFDAIVDWVNDNAVHLDGSKAFTATPSGPATDPVSANQLTRKSYVDALVAAEATTRASADTTNAATAAAASAAAAQGQVALERSFDTIGTSGVAGSVAMLTVSPTLTAGRSYKVSWSFWSGANNSLGSSELILYVDGVVAARSIVSSVSTGDFEGNSGFVVIGPSTGVHTIALNLSTTCVSGALIYCSATAPFTLLVEDLGS